MREFLKEMMKLILELDQLQADDNYKYSYILYQKQVKLVTMKLTWRTQYEAHKSI